MSDSISFPFVQAVYVERNDQNVTGVIGLNQASDYVVDKEGQYVYYVRDASSGNRLGTPSFPLTSFLPPLP